MAAPRGGINMTASGQIRIGARRHRHTHRWMAWRKFITLIGGLAIAWPVVCYAQQPQSAPPKRIGLLSLGQCPPAESRWLQRLAELGWSKGTVAVDCVSSVGRMDDLPAVARELVSRRPDVLAAVMTKFVTALKQETTTIPI